jgi:hypothetical protein
VNNEIRGEVFNSAVDFWPARQLNVDAGRCFAHERHNPMVAA